MQAEDPPKKFNQKEKTQWNINWVGLPKIEVSTKPIISQSLSTNFNNIIMCMEQIFQDINKQMLETTYTLKLGQLLKIALDLKKYMW